MYIVLRNIVIEFDQPRTRVLDDVDLVIEEGERVALLGPSGSGKTSLLRLFLGAVRPTAGEVRLGGRNPFGTLDEVSWLRRRTGCVRQRDDLIPGISGRTNALMATTPAWRLGDWLSVMRGRAPRRYSKDLAALAERYGITSCLTSQVKNLSGGQRQRVALVRALMNRPSLLLADEPTSGLDPRNTSIVIDGILEGSRTVVMATHDLTVAERFDRVVALREGRVTYDGPPPGQDVLDRIYAAAEEPACA
ncbi:ABC transporter ATP-binding protein YxdL [Streptomyces sp. enrichment culture]|uniref:ATP-binding cassette domain-containing protein n=1 Tax=Streptomyces sp. enrichment culture TaxID=1795815 RepID=UPI003F55D5D7